MAALVPTDIEPYLAMMLVGFAVGAWGHLAKSRGMVIIGVSLILLASLLLPIVANLTEETPPPPGPDIRSPE